MALKKYIANDGDVAIELPWGPYIYKIPAKSEICVSTTMQQAFLARFDCVSSRVEDTDLVAKEVDQSPVPSEVPAEVAPAPVAVEEVVADAEDTEQSEEPETATKKQARKKKQAE